MALAPDSNGSVQIAIAGTPSFSNSMESYTLHDEQLPQSPFAISATSTSDANFSTISRPAGAEASPLFRL